jgi:sulfate transport system ATP-binding protein
MIRTLGLHKRFGATLAVDHVDMTIDRGEFVALLGPSGSGKTTLLRLIAGLDQPDGGTIEIAGRDATGVPPGERGIGLVFQHYALFRHMTVFENIAFGLRVRSRRTRPAPAVLKARVEELLALIQLEGIAARLPAQLSGGQRQRVALARALAVEPRILLLDEPFGALDRQVRHELRASLHDLHSRLGITTVLVTHDQDEAMALADRVLIFHQGRLEQDGTPDFIRTQPSSEFVREFLVSEP